MRYWRAVTRVLQSTSFLVSAPHSLALDQALREHLGSASWSAIRRAISSGKVQVDGVVITDPRQQVRTGCSVVVNMAAPRSRASVGEGDDIVLFCDKHLIVVNKPSGISSVDHTSEPDSLQARMRRWLARSERRAVPPLRVVHRLDKVTSGVMLFARSAAAQAHLKDQFRAHTTQRLYVALVHGAVDSQAVTARIVRDRGDGLRGITRDAHLGRSATTHIELVQRFARCSLIHCRLDTGRTHQIRIHLAALGHPLVGDPLYGRDYRGESIPSPRTLLHAARLSFAHPEQRRRLVFEQAAPEAFRELVERERRR